MPLYSHSERDDLDEDEEEDEGKPFETLSAGFAFLGLTSKSALLKTTILAVALDISKM